MKKSEIFVLIGFIGVVVSWFFSPYALGITIVFVLPPLGILLLVVERKRIKKLKKMEQVIVWSMLFILVGIIFLFFTVPIVFLITGTSVRLSLTPIFLVMGGEVILFISLLIVKFGYIAKEASEENKKKQEVRKIEDTKRIKKILEYEQAIGKKLEALDIIKVLEFSIDEAKYYNNLIEEEFPYAYVELEGIKRKATELIRNVEKPTLYNAITDMGFDYITAKKIGSYLVDQGLIDVFPRTESEGVEIIHFSEPNTAEPTLPSSDISSVSESQEQTSTLYQLDPIPNAAISSQSTKIEGYIWLLPFIAGLIGIISFIAPAGFFSDRILGIRINIYSWMFGVIATVDPDYEIAMISESSILIGSIICSALILLTSLFMVQLSIKIRKGEKYGDNDERLPIICGIITIASTIIWIIVIDRFSFMEFFGSNLYYWDIFDPGFGVIGPFIAGVLSLISYFALKEN